MPRGEQEKLTWIDVDVGSIPAKAQKLYKDYKAKQALASEARTKFDEELKKAIMASDKVELEDGQSLRISHQFGKLGFAVSNQEERGRVDKSRFSF